MPGSSSERVVYYEDLVTAKPAKEDTPESSGNADTEQAEAGKSIAAGTKSTAITTAAVSTSNKRQRTLMDMLGPSASGAKKPKLGKSGSFGSQALNSIPFSMSGFINSLGEEEKDLLALECDTMGKSWYALALSFWRYSIQSCV